jgi:hypothetical protein
VPLSNSVTASAGTPECGLRTGDRFLAGYWCAGARGHVLRRIAVWLAKKQWVFFELS